MPPGVSFGSSDAFDSTESTDFTDPVPSSDSDRCPNSPGFPGFPGSPDRVVRRGVALTGGSGRFLGVPRRTLLTGGATIAVAGVLASCSGGDGDEEEAPTDDVGLRRRTARDSSDLLARYDATARVHPALGAPLEPFRAVVTAHLTALGDTGSAPGGGEGSGSGPRQEAAGGRQAGAASGGGGVGPEVPAEQDEAIQALADAERRAARKRSRALADAPPELARLLASLAAAGSAQAYLLNELRKARR
ncbi:hypothetical protein ACTWP5_16315 [Streptomyces sp. 4N509B]|uniref:hypothetical protein n=1 Tax=Streptomyces sp. 4N509B TaxID=3457413 RepID=UPI003FD1223B